MAPVSHYITARRQSANDLISSHPYIIYGFILAIVPAGLLLAFILIWPLCLFFWLQDKIRNATYGLSFPRLRRARDLIKCRATETSIVYGDRIQKFMSRRTSGQPDVRTPPPGLELEPPHLPEIEAVYIRSTKI